MKKFRLQVSIEDYWEYVVEAEDEEKARSRAFVDFQTSREYIDWPSVEIEEVPDNTPLGDV